MADVSNHQTMQFNYTSVIARLTCIRNWETFGSCVSVVCFIQIQFMFTVEKLFNIKTCKINQLAHGIWITSTSMPLFSSQNFNSETVQCIFFADNSREKNIKKQAEGQDDIRTMLQRSKTVCAISSNLDLNQRTDRNKKITPPPLQNENKTLLDSYQNEQELPLYIWDQMFWVTASFSMWFVCIKIAIYFPLKQ